MPYEHKPNTGSLFKSDTKEKETDRDYQGDALIGGVEMWMSAWINEAKDGKKYMKVSFSPKQEVHDEGMAQAKQALDDIPPVDDGDIPF